MQTLYATPNPVELNTLIIMNGNMTELENLCKHYKNVLKTDAELLEDLSDLGWEYTCNRLFLRIPIFLLIHSFVCMPNAEDEL